MCSRLEQEDEGEIIEGDETGIERIGSVVTTTVTSKAGKAYVLPGESEGGGERAARQTEEICAAKTIEMDRQRGIGREN